MCFPNYQSELYTTELFNGNKNVQMNTTHICICFPNYCLSKNYININYLINIGNLEMLCMYVCVFSCFATPALTRSLCRQMELTRGCPGRSESSPPPPPPLPPPPPPTLPPPPAKPPAVGIWYLMQNFTNRLYQNYFSLFMFMLEIIYCNK